MVKAKVQKLAAKHFKMKKEVEDWVIDATATLKGNANVTITQRHKKVVSKTPNAVSRLEDYNPLTYGNMFLSEEKIEPDDIMKQNQNSSLSFIKNQVNS